MRGILTYHSIDGSGSVISTDPARFRGQVAELAEGGVKVTTVAELIDLDDDVDAVALTFDDGFRNFATEAWPVLVDRGLPVTLFVVSDHVGHQNVWDAGRGDIPRLSLLGWETLGRLVEQGVRIGSHTRTHPALSTLHGVALQEELGRSRERISRRLGVQAAGLAYPYGDFGGDAVPLARDHYEWAVTTELRPLPCGGSAPDPHRIPRLDAFYFRKPGSLRAWGTTALRGRLWLRRLGRRVTGSTGRAAGDSR